MHFKCRIKVYLKRILNVCVFTELDRRLGKVQPVCYPQNRVLHYRKFRNGIADMKVYTADDCMALLQQLPYVIGTSGGIIPDTAEREGRVVDCGQAVVKACVCTREILSILKKREVSEDDLNILDEGEV